MAKSREGDRQVHKDDVFKQLSPEEREQIDRDLKEALAEKTAALDEDDCKDRLESIPGDGNCFFTAVAASPTLQRKPEENNILCLQDDGITSRLQHFQQNLDPVTLEAWQELLGLEKHEAKSGIVQSCQQRMKGVIFRGLTAGMLLCSWPELQPCHFEALCQPVTFGDDVLFLQISTVFDVTLKMVECEKSETIQSGKKRRRRLCRGDITRVFRPNVSEVLYVEKPKERKGCKSDWDEADTIVLVNTDNETRDKPHFDLLKLLG